MTKVKVDVKTLRALKGADAVEVARILKKNEATLSPRIKKILAK
jgi:hypothetical protein